MENGICDRHFYGNLRWTSHGEVWAGWRLEALPPAPTEATAQVVHALHTSLFRALASHEVLLAGHLIWSDPAEIMNRMLDGVDLAQADDWIKEVEATADEIAQIPFGERRWSLHVRLNLPTRSRMGLWARTAFNELGRQAGVVPLPPSAAEVETAMVAMRNLESQLTRAFDPTRLTEAEMIWERRHAQSRGTTSLIDPVKAPELAEEFLEVSGRAAIGNPVLDPGGLSELETTNKAKLVAARTRRRWLKVLTDDGMESWQAGLVLSVVPKGMGWPDHEFLGRLDDCAVPVDVAIRMSVRTRNDALRRNKRAMTQLNDQLDQVGEEQIAAATHLLRLTDAAEDLAEYHAEMQREDKEVECAPTIMVSAASVISGDDVDDDARAFLRADSTAAFTWARPLGLEEDIFWASQPGSIMSPELRDYQQLASGRVMGQTAPITNHKLGTEGGILAGINQSTALPKPWFIDLFSTTRSDNLSPSIFVSGEQGAGKSMFLKKLAGAIADRGGQIMALDSTSEKEWFKFLAALGHGVAAVDIAEPELSVDPLRTLPLKKGSKVAEEFLLTLLGLSATKQGEGVTIAKSLKAEYLAEHGIDSMGAWHRHLGSPECTLKNARELADQLDVFIDRDLTGGMAAAVFDSSLPPLDLTARAIVIGINSVVQPNVEELTAEHLFREMPAEKIFGRAMMAMLMGMARDVLNADPGQETALVGDEIHFWTRSPAALRALEEMIRFGRHVQGAVLGGSHNPEKDLVDSTVRGLIKNRLVLRTPDLELARAGARFLGFEARKDDPEAQAQFDATVRSIQNLPKNKGQGIFRDHHGAIGRVQTLMPARPDRREAAKSTPPDGRQTRHVELVEELVAANAGGGEW